MNYTHLNRVIVMGNEWEDMYNKIPAHCTIIPFASNVFILDDLDAEK